MACHEAEDASSTSQTMTPHATPSTTNEDIHEPASSLPAIPQFMYLLSHAKSLISSHGPYVILTDTSIFARAESTCSNNDGDASPAILATSLAAAQDCVDSAQPQGPAKEDIIFFHHLWKTTLAVFEAMLETDNLDIETIGWGVIGLCAGYMVKPPDQVLQSYKTRLSNALRLMPSLDWPGQGPQWDSYRDYMGSTGTTVRVLVTARSEIHACTTMLLQRFAKEDWRTIRWYHGIAVAERWSGALLVNGE
ncbi:hypothetical protein J1614_010341 [Plenodomus biglobosus]|nr:hypothetical protein J1614_010341 [Plenodomus biglobosus]